MQQRVGKIPSPRCMTATLLTSKFRAQKALMRFDFTALQELEPVKIVSPLFFFIYQLTISWSSSGELKHVCGRLLFCILTTSLCVIRQAYMQQHSTMKRCLRKPQILRQVHMTQYSLSHRPNLRGCEATSA